MAMCIGKEIVIYTWWMHLLDNSLQANATRAHMRTQKLRAILLCSMIILAHMATFLAQIHIMGYLVGNIADMSPCVVTTPTMLAENEPMSPCR